MGLMTNTIQKGLHKKVSSGDQGLNCKSCSTKPYMDHTKDHITSNCLKEIYRQKQTTKPEFKIQFKYGIYLVYNVIKSN